MQRIHMNQTFIAIRVAIRIERQYIEKFNNVMYALIQISIPYRRIFVNYYDLISRLVKMYSSQVIKIDLY